MEKYKKALKKEKRQRGCIGGEQEEANLKPLIEMMKHMVKGAKGDKKALAKLKEDKSKLSAMLPMILKQKDQKAGDYSFDLSWIEVINCQSCNRYIYISLSANFNPF